MSPFEIDCVLTEQEAEQRDIDQQRYERYAEGATDAAFGRLPEYADADYLKGYMEKLKQLPVDENGRIKHYSPHQHFAFGYMDEF